MHPNQPDKTTDMALTPKPLFSGAGLFLRWVVLLTLITIALTLISREEARGAAADEVVASVNGERLTRADLQPLLLNSAGMNALPGEAGDIGVSPESLEQLALRKLIHRHLLLQEASRRGITVVEQEVDQAIGSLRQRFPDLKSFGTWMNDQGLDERSLFEAIRSGMLTNRVTADLVENVQVAGQEIEDYYSTHKDSLEAGEEVRFRIILVRSKQAAEEILAELHAGKDFGRLAREKSLGQLARQGGDTGWLDALSLPPLLAVARDRLQPGDVAGPLQKADDEYLLVGLSDRRSLPLTSLAAARPAIEQRLLVIKQGEVIQAWLENQEKAAEIENFLSNRLIEDKGDR